MKDKDKDKDGLSLPDAVGAASVMFQQIGELVPSGMSYYSVRLPDGSVAQFPDEESALRFAAKSGGLVVAQPTRAALRILGAAANATAIETQTSVTVPADNVVVISNPYLSISVITRGDGECTVVATTAVAVGDRVMPSVGAASTDEWARDRRGELPLGKRLANAVMIASTRAFNRGFADLMGLVNLGVKPIQQQESPQSTVIKTARRLGIPPTAIRQIAGVALVQVTEANVADVVAALERYAKGDGDSASNEATEQGE